MLALNSERTRAGVVIDRHKLSRLVAEGALAVAVSVWYTITIERVAGSDGKLAPSGFAVDHMLALNSERTRAGVVIDRHKLSRLVAEGALAVAASVWYTITIERVAGSDGKLA